MTIRLTQGRFGTYDYLRFSRLESDDDAATVCQHCIQIALQPTSGEVIQAEIYNHVHIVVPKEAHQDTHAEPTDETMV